MIPTSASGGFQAVSFFYLQAGVGKTKQLMIGNQRRAMTDVVALFMAATRLCSPRKMLAYRSHVR